MSFGQGTGSRATPARVLAILVGLVLSAGAMAGCSGSEGPAKSVPRPASRLRIEPFPPTGPLNITYRPAAGAGAYYRVQHTYVGSTVLYKQGQLADPKRIQEDLTLELHYQQRGTPSQAEGEHASILIMNGLRQEYLSSEGPQKNLLEIADDRIRLQVNGETRMNVVGGRGSGRPGADSVLGRPFAAMRTDPQGNMVGMELHARQQARAILAMARIESAVRFAQPAFPPGEVLPGATWSARRVPGSPVGGLGLVLDVEHRLVGYEEIRGVQCARVTLRVSLDAEDVETVFGLTLDRVEAELSGEALLDVSTGQPYRVFIEDEISAEYTRGDEAERTNGRMRFTERLFLDRLERPDPLEVWADGSKPFAGS